AASRRAAPADETTARDASVLRGEPHRAKRIVERKQPRGQDHAGPVPRRGRGGDAHAVAQAVAPALAGPEVEPYALPRPGPGLGPRTPARLGPRRQRPDHRVLVDPGGHVRGKARVEHIPGQPET